MSYTKLTKTTTKGLLDELGAVWDKNFTSAEDVKRCWASVWRSTKRRNIVHNLHRAAATLQKSQDDKAPCDFDSLGRQIQNLGFGLCNTALNSSLYAKSKGAKPGKREILALLSAPFVHGIYVSNGSSQTINVVTAPVEIRTPRGGVYPMGQYRICLELVGIPTVTNTLRIFPHHSRRYGSCTHPHIYTAGGVCRGEAGGPMNVLFSSGLLYEGVAFLYSFLQSPAEHGYEPLARFTASGSGAATPICGFCYYSPVRGLRHCKHCKIALCETCLMGDGLSFNKTCPFCGKTWPKHEPGQVKKKPKTHQKKERLR